MEPVVRGTLLEPGQTHSNAVRANGLPAQASAAVLPDAGPPVRLRTLALGVVVALALVWGVKRTHHGRPQGDSIPVAGLTAHVGVEDPCASRPRCLVIYVAPWCPACRQSHGFIAQLQKVYAGSPSLGVRLVIGRDQSEPMRAYAATFTPPPAFFDDAVGTYFHAAGFTAVPTYALLDNTQRLIAQTWQGYGQALPPDMLREWLSDKMQVDDAALPGG